MNLFRSSIMLSSLAVLIGCGEKGAEPIKDPTKVAPVSSLKELKMEDVKVGAPLRFDKKKKPLESGDTAFVVYTGRFADGTEFDSNDPKTKPKARPLEFVLGTGSMIAAFDKGLLGMLPGGERKLSVPYKLGYGEAGRSGIPPKTDLFFDVKLIDYVKRGEDLVFFVNDVKAGTGAQVKTGSKVTIHSVITEVDGNVLEDNRKEAPVSFRVGVKEVLPALDAGMLDMKVGGVRELWIPPAAGFPPDPTSEVSGSTIFHVTIELLKVE